MQQSASGSHGDHGHRVGHILGRRCGAFERVQRDVNSRTIARADLFANEQHGRFIPLPFADDDDAGDIQPIQLFAHGIHCRLISGLFVAPAHPISRGHSSRFADAGKSK